jgi:hypothetical protein
MRKMMKGAAIAAVMALALAACEHPIPVAEEGGLVNLTISDGTDSARALSADLAKLGYNYVEAIFKDPSNAYHRAAGFKGDPIRISVPAGAYASGKTVMLAGRGEDRTLLAIGEMYQVNGTGGTTIAADTTNVTFKLYPLVTGAIAPAAATDKVEYRGKQVPYYNISANIVTAINYGLTFGTAPATLTAQVFWHIADTGASITSWGLTAQGESPTPVVLPMPSTGTAPAFDATAMGATKTFSSGAAVVINLVAGGTPTLAAGTVGWSFLNFRAPVTAFASGVSSPGNVWYVQAGLSNNDISMDATSAGGGLVLNIGGAKGIAVNHAY